MRGLPVGGHQVPEAAMIPRYVTRSTRKAQLQIKQPLARGMAAMRKMPSAYSASSQRPHELADSRWARHLTTRRRSAFTTSSFLNGTPEDGQACGGRGESDDVVEARPVAVPGVHGEGGKAPRQRGVRTSNSLPSGSARHVHGTAPWPTSMSVAPRARSRATSAA